MKNDNRRITAEERAGMLQVEFGLGDPKFRKYVIKMLCDHVKAAHKRHARKNVCIIKKDLSRTVIDEIQAKYKTRASS